MYLIIIYVIDRCFLFRQSGMTFNIAENGGFAELHRLSKALFDVSGLNCHAPGSSLLAGGYRAAFLCTCAAHCFEGLR